MPTRASSVSSTGNLEGEAEGEDQPHHQRDVFADLGQQLERRVVRGAYGLEADEELPRPHGSIT